MNGVGNKNSNWKGGRTKTGSGYIQIYMPNHPRADSRGYVREHILIAENALGKRLPSKAVVHHMNESKADNHTEGNLVICQDDVYHRFLHRRLRALKACGHASWRKCCYCHEYDAPDNLYIGLHRALHRQCQNNYQNSRPRPVRLKRKHANTDPGQHEELGGARV